MFIFILLHTKYQLSNKKDVSLMSVGLEKVFDPVLCTVLSQTVRALGVQEWVISSVFFYWDLLHEIATASMKLQGKKHKKIKVYTKSVLKEPKVKSVS